VIVLSLLKTLFKGVFGIIILFIVLGAVFGSDSSDNTETNSDISETAASSDEPVEETVSIPEDTTNEDASGSDEADKEIVSTSFSDFALYTDSSATELQKETFFNENYKDKYVTWTGTVTTVSESFGSYSVQVKHSPNTLTSDVIVKMRDDQKDKLLQLKEGSEITYTAKMTRYGEILGMSAEEGVIVSTDGTETSSDISETAASSDISETAASSDESAEETVSTTEDTTTEDTTTEDSSSSDESDKEIVSTSFSDFALYTDSSATELQKETFFNENYKDKYVTWTGTVTTVSESYGSYSVGVKHSPNTLTSDVYVKMRDDQKDKLLQLKEGSEITYTAKMTRYGEILGMSAEDGVIE
jgi:cold shock CspA family protein